MARLSFNPNNAVHVTYMDESSVDEGGPGREYFYLTLQCVADDNSIFQGPPERQLFKHNPQALKDKKIFMQGS